VTIDKNDKTTDSSEQTTKEIIDLTGATMKETTSDEEETMN
jgi:hypothetical protein